MGFPSIYSGHWDPFFRACEETGTVINLHVGSSGVILKPDDSSPREVTQALSPLNSLSASVDWIYSRVPIRFPELKIVLSEGGVSWVPMVRERLVRSFRQVDVSDVWTSEDPSPLDLLSRNFWFASLEDPFAFKNIQDVGADNIMIECDYPHPDSTWPITQSILARDLNHLDTRDVFKICVGNACDLYNIPLPPKSRFENSLRGKEALELL